MKPEEVMNLATAPREFLVRRWIAWHEERHRLAAALNGRYEIPAVPSTNMCRMTASFMEVCLRRKTGRPWTVRGGLAVPGAPEGGIVDLRGHWHTHYWLVSGNTLCDLTADQFGYDPILITTTMDARYKQTVPRAEMKRHVVDVLPIVGQWLNQATEENLL